MYKILVLVVLFFLVLACDSKGVYDVYKPLPDKWHKDSLVTFDIDVPDTTNNYNLFINLRNNGSYPFSNIYLITEMTFPNHSKVTDTLEYEMTTPTGEWLGTGFSEIKENKLWYKENIKFPISGVSTIKIGHAMRKNGNELGVEELDGITNVGFRIEKITE